jgi:hypothetical protein
LRERSFKAKKEKSQKGWRETSFFCCMRRRERERLTKKREEGGMEGKGKKNTQKKERVLQKNSGAQQDPQQPSNAKQ